MKEYVKPTVTVIDLRPEERIGNNVCKLLSVQSNGVGNSCVNKS